MTATLDRLGEGSTVHVSTSVSTPETGVEAPRHGFRRDIQGLRAVAVLLVVLYHAGVSWLGGGYVGVDVFFVISGFLITSQLLNEADRTGTVSLAGFYARRIRRLLPPALVVVAATVAVARFWGPALESTMTARDALYAVFYGMNYRLAAQGIDYQNAGASPSPLQHFWSLAVEEQFYIGWPVVVLLVVWLTRRVSRRARAATFGLLAAAAVAASLNESITLTATNGPLAYFSLQTRAWELGVGALVAIGLPLLRRLPALLAAPLTWVGLLAIAASALVFDDATPFPGSLALIPVLGAALVIGGGVVSPVGGAELALRSRLAQFIGRVSYGWYLWHWPAVMLAPALFRMKFGVPEKLALSLLALWFAVLTFLLIEQVSQRRRFRPRRWFAIAGSMSLVVAAVSATAIVVPPAVQGRGGQVAALDLRYPSQAELATVLAEAVTTTAIPSNLNPALPVAAQDFPITSKNGCHLAYLSVDQPLCAFGDVTATRTIVLFGDSHAEQWWGALNTLGQQLGWRVLSWTKSACPLADVTLFSAKLDRSYTECDAWRRQTMDTIARINPELVIVSQLDTLPGSAFSNTDWADGTARTLAELKKGAGQVVYLADTPTPLVNIPSCLADNIDNARACSFPASSARSKTDNLRLRRELTMTAAYKSGVDVLDPTPWFCANGRCPAVVGDTLVYRDDSHMTQYYSRALEPILQTALAELNPEMAQE